MEEQPKPIVTEKGTPKAEADKPVAVEKPSDEPKPLTADDVTKLFKDSFKGLSDEIEALKKANADLQAQVAEVSRPSLVKPSQVVEKTDLDYAKETYKRLSSL